jgi:hypothetical protein
METPDAPTRWTWTDDDVVRVMTAQDYIARCEHRLPGFASLKAFVDAWAEARVRHAIAKDSASVDRARARLIHLAQEICSMMDGSHVAGPGAVSTETTEPPADLSRGAIRRPRRGRVADFPQRDRPADQPE